MQFKRRLAAFKRDLASRKSRLPADDEIDLIFLQWQVEAELIDLNVIREWSRNPMGYAGLPGNAVDLLIKRDFAPPAVRLRAVISREKEFRPCSRPPGKTSRSLRESSPTWRSAWQRARSVFRGPCRGLGGRGRRPG